MKIVVLDRCTIVSNGDISLDPICSAGDTVIYDMLSEDEIIAAASDADALICNKANINRRIIYACKNLKYVGLFATGYNNIDLEAANERGIYVVNAPGYSTNSVVQHTIGLMIALASGICSYNASVKSGEWCKSAAFTYLTEPTVELCGKTLGIFGFGTIGKAVARAAEGLGMKIIASTRTVSQSDKYEFVSRDELFMRSDFLTLHCPLNEATREIVNKRTLSLMKKSAYIINTARGGCVNEAELYSALSDGTIAGAAIDVVTVEPMAESNPLRLAPNIIITPHVAWATVESRRRLVDMVADGLNAFKNGHPVNVVNSPENFRL